jgi:2-dehydro-3-deoxyphosphogluconate aldolase/(4S)-4-hydroxy-2-oxoglutarate aldolase
MHAVLEQIGLRGIVPVVVINDAAHAGPLAEALMAGGLPCIEITFRTGAAQAAIGTIAKSHPGMLLGAGTVLTVDQVKLAVDLGAKYIVSPGFNRKVVEYCLTGGIPVTPGVATPTEIEAALELGLEVVKFFPAEANGGLPFLKAIAAPYKKVRFIPTGGIDESNLLAYLKFPQVLACGGSWMVKAELISGGKFDEIRKLTAQAVNLMLGLELRHVGMNMPDAEAAQVAADRLSAILPFPQKDGTGSVFVGTQFEVLKRNFLGAHGHLAIGTHFIHRAIAHLEGKGFRMRPDTRNEKDGKLLSVYLEEEIGGFALHLLQM